VYHFAGQVAVTVSVADPRRDFLSNAAGTLNVLESVRAACPEAVLFYASTNKVYGALECADLEEGPTRYRLPGFPLGVPEHTPLDFHSPYGCSKGCGDQYVRDYARIYGLRTVVFRQSCIYGTRQFGVEDQGWLAHFCFTARAGRPIRICGNGKQVRDVLWIDDLVSAFDCAAHHIDTAAGEVFNIGGGPANAVSIWHELGPKLERLAGHAVHTERCEWRPGDQRVYVSDIRKAGRVLSWRPQVGLDEGLERLWRWVCAQQGGI
jgi:CDP-paratose 2-epimerase